MIPRQPFLVLDLASQVTTGIATFADGVVGLQSTVDPIGEARR